jgi:hypothetical protein
MGNIQTTFILKSALVLPPPAFLLACLFDHSCGSPSQMPFEVGEEVMFKPKTNEIVEGIVVDVGWYRCVWGVCGCMCMGGFVCRLADFDAVLAPRHCVVVCTGCAQ